MMVTAVDAQVPYFGRNRHKAKSEEAGKKEKEEKVQKGFFSVQKEKEDWYFQVADSLLDVPFLAVTRYVSTPVELGTYGGELVNSDMFYWQKQDNKLLLRLVVHDANSPSGDAIHQALKVSTENPIIASIKIEKTIASKEAADTVGGKRYKIKVNDLLNGDNMLTGLTTSAKSKHSIQGLQGNNSYVESIHTYPTNTEISTVKTYGSKDSKAWSSKIAGSLTFRLNTSIVMLPRKLMRQRYFDQRVGYFTEGERYYSDEQQQTERRQFATRWRLEPKSEADAIRQKNGELIEPKKPIVYYIDPATPKQWRPYLIQGVNDWNAAFEQAGWKNAIRAEEWPEERPDMSLEDARYSVIRYLASPIQNAYGPHISDPRTGEILNSCIGWYHNVMALIHDWYMIQAGAIDERARQMRLPDELMGELIRFVSSHEVGHTLGLRHNMGASSRTPLDSLRNKEWVEKNGHTASIMDYARFNYVAQPGDGIGAEGIMPRINTYDKWAIEWGYKYFADAKSADEEKLILNKMTIERLAKDKRLWFGGEGRDNDPCALTEDLSDDPIGAAEYGIMNLKRIIGDLPKWSYEEADNYTNLKQVVGSLVGQFGRYVGHAMNNVAGVHHDYKTVEQEGAVYTPASKERTKKALDFLDRQVLTEPKWITSQQYLSKITSRPTNIVIAQGEMAASYLVSYAVMERVCSYDKRNGAYAAQDYVDDVMKILFKELYNGGVPDEWRRMIHREAVMSITKSWEKDQESSAHPYYTMMMTELETRLKAAMNSGDKLTKAHYKDLLTTIKKVQEKE